MSQEKPRRPEQEPIKYGDVFNVSGELASKPITPRDAATVQSAENQTLGGYSPKDGPASLMSSAAAKNEAAGFVGHKAVNNITRHDGVVVSETNEPGNNNRRVLTETLGGQVLGKFVKDSDEVKGNNRSTGGSTVDDEGDPDAASAEFHKVEATGDYDYINNQGGAGPTTMNPRFSENQDENTMSNDSMATETINSVPGGMGASMATATADRVKKNK